MKIDISQAARKGAANTLSTVKRVAANGFNCISNIFERTPGSDIFTRSIRFEKPNVSKSEKKYIDKINKIPVIGLEKEELPILNLVHESIFKMLKFTNGKSEPYTQIVFCHRPLDILKPDAVACVYSGTNSLYINKDFLNNIDGMIATNTKVFEILKWIEKDENGKYKIKDILRNSKSEQYEKLLNEYTPDWSLKEKFELDNLGTYYRNLANRAYHSSDDIIEKIFSDAENCEILKKERLFEKRNQILPNQFAREKYLNEIGKFCHLPEDACLINSPEIVFSHEYMHKWCFDNFSKEYLSELHYETTKNKWIDDKNIQLTAHKVSYNAMENPMEYIAEVGAGLAGGQKFDKDIMLLYESLKGPKF